MIKAVVGIVRQTSGPTEHRAAFEQIGDAAPHPNRTAEENSLRENHRAAAGTGARVDGRLDSGGVQGMPISYRAIIRYGKKLSVLHCSSHPFMKCPLSGLS